jgi:hypothetical protein
MVKYSQLRHFALVGSILFLGLGVWIGGQTAQAAEKVTIKAGGFGRSISVTALKEYAQTGTASPELASLLRLVSAEREKSLVGLLNTKLPFNVVAVDKLLQSPPGEQLLKDIGGATILPGDGEIPALRGALLGAAAQDKMLNFVTVLEKYPTPTLTVDILKLGKILKENPALGALIQGQGGGAPSAPHSGDVPKSGDIQPKP